MSTTVEQLLEDCSIHLIEIIVNTLLGTTVTPGVQTVTPGSMTAIYVGAQLIVDTGGSQEIITVSAIPTATTFTATFANSHGNTAVLFAATFPSGQTDHPLFTQSEMIGYVADVQNDLLLKVRPIYNIVTQGITNGIRFYQQPSDSIRLERVAIGGNSLFDTAQADIDMTSAEGTQPGNPKYFFQDETTSPTTFGFKEIPQINNTAEIWYSQRAASQLSLNSLLMVPDFMAHYIKYGVLARAWSKDGEQRDPNRAAYCQKRFDLGVQLSIRIIDGIGAAMGQEQKRTPSSFSPIAVGK